MNAVHSPDDLLVRMIGIHMHYGKVVGLNDVSLDIGRNEIVGLVGDNGAGKSTLIKVLTGVETPTAGRLVIKGKDVEPGGYSVRRAHDWKIETVYQDRSLGEKQPLWRNFFVGRPIKNRFGFIDVKAEKKIAEQIMKTTIGFRSRGIGVDSVVGRLSGGERQGVAIARAIYNKADLIVLDEPTTALSLTETEKVFRFVRAVRASGRSILFIGHNIHHVYDIADRFVVLDRGRVALTTTKAEVGSAEDLIAFMEHVAHPKGVHSFDPGAAQMEAAR
jgi:simple sugar transport system ATP-binding protein